MSNLNLFTSESVGPGHPDKICDQLSDAILDECYRQDKHARVAAECLVTTDTVIISGEISTTAKIDYERIVRQTLLSIGYSNKDYGIDANTCKIINLIKEQSSDIALGVNKSDDLSALGAGDQGMMFGYASDETSTFMPLPIHLAHALVKRADELRKSGELKYARPDMKSQVTIDYSSDKLRIDTILMSVQHDPDFDEEEFKKDLKEKVMDYVARENNLNDDYRVLINPTGRFVIGGPQGDTGLTGRKIIVDTYGGSAHHGGGAFSGKDCTKVDRSAAYFARYIAKNIVAAKLAKRCEIQLAYAIGKEEPVSLFVDTYNTGVVSDKELVEAIWDLFDLRPAGIIKALDLTRPIYQKTATFGHFGRDDVDFTWERIDKVDELKKYFNK